MLVLRLADRVAVLGMRYESVWVVISAIISSRRTLLQLILCIRASAEPR
jgi:hypothetical protein